MATTRKEPDPQGSDQVLIRRVLAGDETALAALYDRYAGLVYSVACRILRDTGAAEEVLQDIFYQLWRDASRFDFGRGSLAGWLLVAARNRAIDRLRLRASGGFDETLHESVSMALDLESTAARSEAVAKIVAALAGLPEGQRQAFELAYFEGLTHSEIAQRIGEPLGTVKTRLRTALQALRRVLNP